MRFYRLGILESRYSLSRIACTYLRPIGRPGPVPGLAKRTPTPRRSVFLDQRSLSPEDYKNNKADMKCIIDDCTQNIATTPAITTRGKEQDHHPPGQASRLTSDPKADSRTCSMHITNLAIRQYERGDTLEAQRESPPPFLFRAHSQSTWARNKKHLVLLSSRDHSQIMTDAFTGSF